MKNLIIIFGLLLISLVFQSCKKEFLDVAPEGQQDYNSYYSAPYQVEESVNGIYNVLQWDFVHGRLDWVYGDVVSDDTDKGGENDADQPEMREMELYIHNAGNSLIAETWNQIYTGIFRANVVLARIDEVPSEGWTSLAYKERLRAEAKFLRAYFYYRLNIMFGGVPLITSILQSDEFEQPRASTAEVWAQIESDLNASIPFLPEKFTKNDNMNYDPTKDLGRATKGAAQTLLCKAYLYQKKWALARTEAENVINSGTYSLTTLSATVTFDMIFDLEHEENAESIFEVHCGQGYKYDYNYGWGNGDLGSLMNVYWLSRAHGGWGFNNPTKNLFQEFETGDIRRGATIAKHGDKLLYGITAYNTKHSPSTFCPRKYIVPVEFITNSLSQGPSNFRIFRYADVLLMHAEACAMLGDTLDGIDSPAGISLMEVRKRVGISTMASSAKYPGFLDKIYHERRVELACEGQRFFDLVRWGLADAKLGPLGYKAYNAVFPIPEGEIQLSGNKIIQNIGYN